MEAVLFVGPRAPAQKPASQSQPGTHRRLVWPIELRPYSEHKHISTAHNRLGHFRGSKRVGLNDVGSGIQILAMNLFDNFRAM